MTRVRYQEREFIDNYCVATVHLSCERGEGMWYETSVFPADGQIVTDWLEVWETAYATQPEAVEGHARVCEQLRAGELEIVA